MPLVCQVYNDTKSLNREGTYEYIRDTLGVKVKAEINEMLVALRTCGGHVLSRANHPYFLELSLASRGSDEMLDYVASQLNNGYNRTVTTPGRPQKLSKLCINGGMKHLCAHFDRKRDQYSQMPLADVLSTCHAERENTLQVEQQRRQTIEQRTTELREQQRAQEEQMSAALVMLSGLQNIFNEDRPRAEPARHGITENEEHYCKANRTVCIFDWSEDGDRPEKYYINKELLTKYILKPCEDDNACGICMTIAGVHQCGNENCRGWYCPRCYHDVSKLQTGDKCAYCQRLFIRE